MIRSSTLDEMEASGALDTKRVLYRSLPLHNALQPTITS